MRRQLRLTKHRDFTVVFRDGRIWADRRLALRAGANDLDHNRYGFIVSKRIGNAVVRNKVRRRLRESALAESTRPGWDIIVSARTSAAQADSRQLRISLSGLLDRAGILAINAHRSGGR